MKKRTINKVAGYVLNTILIIGLIVAIISFFCFLSDIKAQSRAQRMQREHDRYLEFVSSMEERGCKETEAKYYGRKAYPSRVKYSCDGSIQTLVP